MVLLVLIMTVAAEKKKSFQHQAASLLHAAAFLQTRLGGSSSTHRKLSAAQLGTCRDAIAGKPSEELKLLCHLDRKQCA